MTWLFIGRNSILLKASTHFSHFCLNQIIDSLHVHPSYYGDEKTPWLSNFGDFPDKYQKSLIDSIKVKRSENVIEKSEIDSLFVEDVLHFSVWINRKYPFYSEVSTAESIYGFGTDYTGYWIWLFGWYETPYVRSGCS